MAVYITDLDGGVDGGVQWDAGAVAVGGQAHTKNDALPRLELHRAAAGDTERRVRGHLALLGGK